MLKKYKSRFFNLLKILLLPLVILSASALVHAQSIYQSQQSEINVQEINDKPIATSYTNQTTTSKKPIFQYNTDSTQINEYKDYGHFQRDINIKSSIGSYKLNKSLNGAINDEKTNRTTSVPLFKF